jgi:hypothetical protein
MKKKSPRGIPDFSRRKPTNLPVEKSDAPKIKPFGPRAPIVKPQSTNAKSGRRGS